MMEVLFEFQGSRRLLKPQSSEAVVELVLAEVKKFDQYAFILCGSISDNDSEQSNAEPRVGYILTTEVVPKMGCLRGCDHCG